MQSRARSHLYVRWIFLRLLSLCFLAAFASIAVQIVGLYGQNGILPIKEFLTTIESQLGLESSINFPSIFWCNAGDGFMQIVCWSGILLSVLAFLGIFTGPVLAILWFLYLSIVSVGQEFMGFQWDSLLLETGLLSVWFAPWGMREVHPFDSKKFEQQRQPSYIFLWLLRFLCFKLMLLSGLCKIASNDHTWRDLSAMAFHYETQPLPTPLAWLAHKIPESLQKISSASVFLIEIGLSLTLLTLGRIMRIVSACAFIMLMIAIMLTGNYAFFNWLTIALSITLLDDDAIKQIMPRSMKMQKLPGARRPIDLLWNSLISIVPATVIGISAISFFWLVFDRYTGMRTLPRILQIPIVLFHPLRSINSYGLFSVMTTSRPEIIIEGSNDGNIWMAYEFKFKPGDLRRAPPIVAPHQPRLDWQMWFAALGPANRSPWFDSFVKKLLEGSADVLALMDKNPFPEKPPRQIRAMLYDYHFSSFDALFQKGDWWRRKQTEMFYPPTSLEDLNQTLIINY